MDLPPKTLRQQIARKSSDVAKVPLTSARPVTSENSQDSLPGTNPKPRLATATPMVSDPILRQPTGEKPVKAPSNELQKSLDSLPVLSAFQEFLDNERERMRKRMIALSITYVLALIIIVSASMTGGMIMIKRLKNDFLNIQKEVTKLQTLSLKNRTDADTLAERLSAETMKLRLEMGTSSDETKIKLATQITDHNDKLNKMDTLVQSIQKENALMKDNLTAMQAQWLNINNNLTTSLARFENLHVQTGKIPPSEQLATAMVMSITPRRQNHTMEIRIPIPE